MITLIDLRQPPGSVKELAMPEVRVYHSPVGVSPSSTDHPTAPELMSPRGSGAVDPFQEYGPGPAPIDSLAEYGTLTKPARDAQPVPEVPVQGVRRQGSGALIRELLSRGISTEEILAENLRQFPSSKATKADVGYHRSWMKQDPDQRAGSRTVTSWSLNESEGQQLPPPSPETQMVSAKELASDVLQVKQPLRSTVVPSHVDLTREFDQTSLTDKSHGELVHRDYAAHFFRWGFVGRFIETDQTTILDVGCGPDTPLVRSLRSPRNFVPKLYVGCDLNLMPKRKPPSFYWTRFHWGFNFLEQASSLEQFDLVTCFEMIEHMRREDGIKLLHRLRERLEPAGILLLSTPVFSGRAAANHLHEWGIEELRTEIEGAGLRVEGRYGTFGNVKTLKRAASVEHAATMSAIEKFYSAEVAACFLAPLYPDASRNNVWVLKLR